MNLFIPVQAQKFTDADPVWEDDDRIPIPLPAEIEFSQIADMLRNTFLYRPKSTVAAAENVNTLGEVPDSSWFTNRMSRRPMSIEELVRGPNQFDDGPLFPLEVIAVKEEGITPGLRVRDDRGDVYLIKFDPFEYPQLTTSTEVIVTKFFHAFGYNVPENYLVYVRADDFEISPRAMIEEHDELRPLTRRDLNYLLDRVPRLSDGTIQVVASRFLPGSPLGPFNFFRTRSDDPNDIFPHENRRELRGMRLFAAWLNHDDSRSINTLDTYLPKEDKGHIRHYLIDFGSTLGSGTIKPQAPSGGHEYILEWPPMWKAAVTLGIRDRRWRKAKYPNYPSVGRIEAGVFHPPDWKPEYPNPAFERMLMEDAFWAAKIIQRFSNEMIRAIVGTGKLENPEAEEYLIDVLIKRRDKILGYYLSRINPLDRFEISEDSSALIFENLGLEAGLSSKASYRYQWFTFDNETIEYEPISREQSATVEEIPVPVNSAFYLMVRIRTINEKQPSWAEGVSVYIRNAPQKEIVGIERAGAK